MSDINDYTEFLVGYDARETYLDFNVTWTPERKAWYLIRQDLVKPLSTDVMVWDSVFHDQGVKLPDWVGPRQEQWENLDELRSFPGTAYARAPYWLIAVTQWATDYQIARDFDSRLLITPAEVSAAWTFLGFDVSDFFLLSGLMNCGTTDEAAQARLRRDWAAKLNEYHLFTDWDDAFAFKELCDEDVREHAPFYVFGLYVIEKHA